ncbi:SLATT domain-containing protein, partial [Micromonospora sp. CPCC 205714]
RRADTVLDDAGDLVAHTLGVAPVARPLPDVRDVPSYLTSRVRGQVAGYYAPMAERMARLAARIRWAATAVTVASALLAATVGVLGDGLGLTAWLGVAATATTALVGYGAAQQYEAQQIEFARTADQLTRLCLTRETGHGWTDDDAFVAEAERIISVSNEGWMAKMIEEDGAAQQ